MRNVELNLNCLPQPQYLDFMPSLDCYVNLAKGEGFSIPPREALDLGIPTVLTDNTALKTLCRTKYVRSVPSHIREPTWVEIFLQYHGEWFNKTVEDVARALKEGYNNYSAYLEKTQHGRAWVKQYLLKNLKPNYLNLVKPQKIILGHRDELKL